MSSNLRVSASLMLVIAFTLLFSSCKKDDDNNSNPITPSGPTLKTTVTGRITDTNGSIISGVIVKLGSITTVSDSRGYFLFVNADVPKERLVLVATKSGYFDCIRGKKTQEGDANYINLMMETLPAAATIQSSAGGLVIIQGGATITFPANAFVDQNGNAYNGQVNVYSRHISPGADNFETIIPGGDLLGINTMGEEQSLYSLGMIEAKLYDNTGIIEVKLATGSTAELKFPIDPSQNSVAQSTIPMWHLDEETGIWQEEGQATKSGNFYIANVSHFSTWNCDYPGERTDIKGLVVDCQNNPMANIVVTINGFQNVTTDNLGVFTTWVPVGYLIQCQVLQSNNTFLSVNSPVQSITAVAGQVNIIPTLVVPCATRITGTIKTCGGVALSPAFVYLNWNGGSSMFYSHTGVYDIYVPENTNINIAANTYASTGNISVTTGASGTMITAPVIELCNAQVLGLTKFTLNTTGIGSGTYLLTTTFTNTLFTDQDLDGVVDLIDIVIQGINNPPNHSVYMNFHIATATQIDNYYLIQSPGLPVHVFISMDSTLVFSSGSAPALTNNHLIITDYGSPGGVMSGTFNFDLPTGSVTDGEFSVIRNN